MTVIMFQERFAGLVECGTKRQTIRPVRKRPWRHDQPLSLRTWTDKPYRSPHRLLCTAKLLSVEGIIIHADGVELSPGTHRRFWMGSQTKRHHLLEDFARLDGFASWSELRAWFDEQHGLPFEGQLIKWASAALNSQPSTIHS